MKKIQLSGKQGVGKFALVDDADFDHLSQFKWHLSGPYASKSVGRRPNKSKISMHRLLLAPPNGMMVDHIDGNQLNNQRGNLRICTNSQNVMNAKKSVGKSSRFKGVSKIKPWRASIGVKILGHFETEIEAAKAYDAAAKALYGEFARLNFID